MKKRPAKRRSPIEKNKEQTKRRFLDAVGRIVQKEGFGGLKVNKIAREAKADKQLIYRYFDTPKELVLAHIQEKDYWMAYADEMTKTAKEHAGGGMKNLIISILTNQYEFFLNDDEMQKLILYQITEKNPLMDGVSQARDDQAKELLQLATDELKGTGLEFRGISALIVAGIYHLVFHSKSAGGTFCGIDLNTADGHATIQTSIRQMIGLVFKEKERNA